MNIIERVENIFQRKCTVCRRPKRRAIGEQVERLTACGVEECPYHADIFSAIKEAQQLELLEFFLSKNLVLCVTSPNFVPYKTQRYGLQFQNDSRL